ncbi:MAG: amidohydrolase family protein [Sphaerochaetaceae bacterium]|nr:amidohydrolase family protein [Sphaerochaetaceae bacterium]
MIIFKNALITDGTDTEPYRSDVVVKDGKIEKTGKTEDTSCEVLDCSSKILCPGFIDVHAHSELQALRQPQMTCKTLQGITTDISGNCGIGVWPRKKNDPPCFADIVGTWDRWNWTDFTSFTENFRAGINMGFLQSHSTLRMAAIKGNPNRPASDAEIELMCELLDRSLSQGCLGFSSGLYYAPCLFAEEKEIVSLLKTVKKHNAVFTVHHRCEGDEILSSIDEVINYAEKAGCQLEISHLKVIGMANQDKVDIVREKIRNARKRGVNVAFDQYPYTFGSTSLFSLLPPSVLKLDKAEMKRALRGDRSAIQNQMENPDGWDSIVKLCGFDNINIKVLDSRPDLEGKALSELGSDPYSALFDILADENGAAVMTDTTETEESLIKILNDDLMCFGTDALYTGAAAHPRSFEAAPHLLKRYVLETGTLSLAQAVSRMTGRCAERFGFKDIGFIREGMNADITLLDEKDLSVTDVYVNGKCAVKDGKTTDSINGNVIFKEDF